MQGKRLAAYLTVCLLVAGLAVAGYVLVQRTKVYTKVRQTYSLMSMLGESLSIYQNATNTPVPFLDTEEGPVMNREALDEALIARLPVTVDLTKVSDPYAPAEGGPFHYWTDGTSWTVWSAGPDRKYEIKERDVYAVPLEALLGVIPPRQFDPTNGTRSGGDLVYYFRPNPAGGGPGE